MASDRGAQITSLQSAKDMCLSTHWPNCTGIYNENCTGSKDYKICIQSPSDWEDSGKPYNSCMYKLHRTPEPAVTWPPPSGSVGYNQPGARLGCTPDTCILIASEDQCNNYDTSGGNLPCTSIENGEDLTANNCYAYCYKQSDVLGAGKAKAAAFASISGSTQVPPDEPLCRCVGGTDSIWKKSKMDKHTYGDLGQLGSTIFEQPDLTMEEQPNMLGGETITV